MPKLLRRLISSLFFFLLFLTFLFFLHFRCCARRHLFRGRRQRQTSLDPDNVDLGPPHPDFPEFRIKRWRRSTNVTASRRSVSAGRRSSRNRHCYDQVYIFLLFISVEKLILKTKTKTFLVFENRLEIQNRVFHIFFQNSW